MDNWFIDSCIGMHPPLIKRVSKSKDKIKRNKNRIIEKECSVSYFISLIPLETKNLSDGHLIVRGYQLNKNNNKICSIEFTTEIKVKDNCYVIKDIINTRMTHFSCYDTTVLYLNIISNGKTNIYYTKFSGCCVLRNPRIDLYEILFFEDHAFYKFAKTPSLMLKIKSLNLKRKVKEELHYNWYEENINVVSDVKNQYEVSFRGICFYQQAYECIFCFKCFDLIENLLQHFKIFHLNYETYISNELFYINKAKKDENVGLEFQFFSKTYRQKKLKPVIKPQNDYIRTVLEKEIHEIDFFKSLEHMININLNDNTHMPNLMIELMKKWNSIKIRGKHIKEDIKTLLKIEYSNPYIMEFLFVLFRKAVINKNEFIEYLNYMIENLQ